jgi:2-keto-4-pentenoate hydratase/2-oxohepta-3-ene-1,7-dioic acid hydratase in catechol pathway
MKFASFISNNRRRIGIATADDALYDITDIVAGSTRCDADMLDLIGASAKLLPVIQDELARSSLLRVSAENFRWLPPVPRPGKICGIAMNNSASNERKIEAPDHPAFFLKPPSCLVGHNEAIRVREYYGSVHPEPELAVVIGTKARDVDAKDAMSHVFGYSIFNDITGNGMRGEDLFRYWALYRDADGELERREQHLSYAGRYKGSDTFGCMGPWLVTKDEVEDPDALGVFCSVAGETIAEDNTGYYNYKVAEIISFISQFQTLEPGDVISCGTAFKPSADRKSIHHANFQVVAGPVEVRIEGLGILNNPVIVERQPIGRWRL